MSEFDLSHWSEAAVESASPDSKRFASLADAEAATAHGVVAYLGFEPLPRADVATRAHHLYRNNHRPALMARPEAP